MCFTVVIAQTGGTFPVCFSTMIVPGLVILYEFFTRTGVPVFRTGSIDRDTSGLCVIAKNALAASGLQGECRKIYYAAVHGIIEESGTIDAPIARRQQSIITRCVSPEGRRAVTHYRRLSFNEKYSLAEIVLETGRTHQIRVHFSHIGHPLAGDDLYGGLRENISRQALHCGEMSFTEPVSGEPITVNAPLPDDIEGLF